MGHNDHLSSFQEAMAATEPPPTFSVLKLNEKGEAEEPKGDEFDARLHEIEKLSDERERHAGMARVAREIAESGDTERAYYIAFGIGSSTDKAGAFGEILPVLVGAKNMHAWEMAQFIVESQIANAEKERFIAKVGSVDWKFSEDMRRDWLKKKGLR
jgi:hypothetical protein